MFNVQWPKTVVNPLSDSEQQKMQKSISESESLTFRPVFCLMCKTILIEVAEDISGHMAIKCHKCKAVIPINAAYFKRSEYIALIKKRNEYIVPMENK